ncbi:TetR/AcrR family transcriptional regulator [Leptolyngbya sp. 15MV]|nr:TetR/AcrR family transcriptional regulator [Leptolyngbya sp. 15MV]
MVTVSTSSEAYHHGALREALVEAGVAALEGPDGAELSLRELARGVGVSATAVYRHFPNKQALLNALARRGLEMLGEAQQAASDTSGGSFAEVGRAYVRFALAHPALFRLVFTHAAHGQGAPDESSLAGKLLRQGTAAIAGGPGPEAERLALQAWAIAHGVAMLMLDRQLPPDQALIDRLLDTGSLFPAQGIRSEASP